ncbi:TfuA-like protein [Bradyrhizobium sp. sBnM-33]|uniref:TfuA-like protein n=1 Tax=Bradyrhizobium sp. sBnM-33 TaxID=2831780 RepID=UPI001BCBDADA|nr:TfuA-like protein [Bradyrhizobium sp. sBnM-33]WOH53279.1 TfuA-like protein [Bradyrhizobium sp. sBnM-33]
MSTPVVFTGLSLSQEEARTLLAAEVRPPVKRGDLDQLSDGTVAAIIDGELGGDSAVPIDEIRRALRRGVKIIGAASVGALRAYEAREDGMVGLGWVYRAYCTGRIWGIDEIAVIYDPDSYRSLTIPLVNVRFCLERLTARRGISAGEADHAMASLKQLSIGKRDRRNIVLHLAGLLGRERVRKMLKLVRPAEDDVKKSDAYELLRTLAKGSNN